MKSLKPAFFLASSWFWCIGGFFPVLLIAEFGKIAFTPFFVFNILGAAAFGFTLNKNRREDVLSRFLIPNQWFSVIIVGYQTIFITWISILINSPLPIIAFIVFSFLFYKLKNKLFSVSVVLFFITIALFLVALLQPYSVDSSVATNIKGFGHYVLPTALGFLLAPYFDLTFHRAYKESDNPRKTFFIGFGILFSIFLFGMFFAAPFLSSLWIDGVTINSTSLVSLIAILTMQLSFTNVAHLYELKASGWLEKKSVLKLLGVVGLLIVIHIAVAILKNEEIFNFGSLFYRSFLYVIGTVFPVIFIFGGLNKRTFWILGLITPCYTLGFLVGGSFVVFLSIAMLILTIAVFVSKTNYLKTFLEKEK